MTEARKHLKDSGAHPASGGRTLGPGKKAKASRTASVIATATLLPRGRESRREGIVALPDSTAGSRATDLNGYTSHLLSHFVGTTDKGEPIDTDRQYDRLASVLNSRCLSANARESRNYKCDEGHAAYRLNPFAVFTKDELYLQSCVCFCDIPEGSLAIHS